MTEMSRARTKMFILKCAWAKQVVAWGEQQSLTSSAESTLKHQRLKEDALASEADRLEIQYLEAKEAYKLLGSRGWPTDG